MGTREQKKISKVAKLYEEGLTVNEMSEQLGLSRRQILRLLHYYLALKYNKEGEERNE